MNENDRNRLDNEINSLLAHKKIETERVDDHIKDVDKKAKYDQVQAELMA